MPIFYIVYNDQKLYLLSFIAMETPHISENSNNDTNSIAQGNSDLRDTNETMCPGVFEKKLRSRQFSFSYQESISLGSVNLSHNLSMIFSSSVSENRQRSKSLGKYKILYI